VVGDVFENSKKLRSIGAFIGEVEALENWEVMLEVTKVFWDFFDKDFNSEKCSLWKVN